MALLGSRRRVTSVSWLLAASLLECQETKSFIYYDFDPFRRLVASAPTKVDMQRRVSRSTAAAFACLAATVEALTAMPALVPVPRTPLRHAQRSRTLFADVAAGWTTRADPNGDTYYFNEQTGQSQWELPQQAPGAPMLWRVVPATALSVKAILLLGTLSAVECLRHQTFFQFSLAHLPIVHPHKVL